MNVATVSTARSRLSPEHRAIIERVGVRALMSALCLYALDQHDVAYQEGCTGDGWYDLACAIDDITPSDVEKLWGDAAERDAPCRGCRTLSETCTC